MSKRSIFLIILIGFILIDGFSQQDNRQLLEDIRGIIREELHGENRDLVPLTWNIVSRILEIKKEDEFKNIEYYLSADITLIERPGATASTPNGGLVYNHGEIVLNRIISRSSKGNCESFNFEKRNEENFTIKYGDIKFVFKRNLQTGRFDLIYLDSPQEGTNYSIEGQRPHLYIYYTEVGAANPQNNATGQRSQPQMDQRSQSQIREDSPRMNQIPVLIMGRGTLSRDTIITYIMSKNSNPILTRQQIFALVNEYINEAMREGVNHDIAIAQMCFATGYLSNRQLLGTYNYAGLNAENGISVRYGNKHGNMLEGVWAHIQHLKGYASYERPLREIVNQRYYLLVNSGIQGTVRTLDDLFTTWAPNNSVYYGNGIRRILNEMYQSNRFI